MSCTYLAHHELESVIIIILITIIVVVTIIIICYMQGGGVQVNNVRITSEDHEVSLADLIEGRLLLLAAGKKNKLLVRVS